MLKSVLQGLMAVLLVSVAWWSTADDQGAIAINPDNPGTYYVKEGDTLWDISSTFLKNPWQWPEIWHTNQQIDNPHLIYPGDVLTLQYQDGRPVLIVDRQAEQAGAEGVSDVGSSGETVAVVQGNGVVKLSPRVRSQPISSAIPAVPLEAIQPYLADNRVVSEQENAQAPYVVAGEDKRIITGLDDIVYARDKRTRWQNPLADYGVFRVGRTFQDPVTFETLGTEAIYIGTGDLQAVDGDIATLHLSNAKSEVRIEDILIGTDARKVNSTFYPKGPNQEINGEIIATYNSISHAGRNEVVVINQGQREGLEEGDVLTVYQAGEMVKDRRSQELVSMPDTKEGMLIVFRTFEKISYALILDSKKALAVGDRVSNPSLIY